jgi:hypothetical protein
VRGRRRYRHDGVGGGIGLDDPGLRGGRAYLDRQLRRALDDGRATHAANAYAHLGRRSAELYQFDHAERYLSEGLAFTDGRDLDTFNLMMRAWQSFTLIYRGFWTEAARVARGVLLCAGTSAVNRLPALVAFGRLHARAAVSGARGALDEALALSVSIGTAETLGMVRAARAEAAWLAGNYGRSLEEASAAYEAALRERRRGLRENWPTGVGAQALRIGRLTGSLAPSRCTSPAIGAPARDPQRGLAALGLRSVRSTKNGEATHPYSPPFAARRRSTDRRSVRRSRCRFGLPVREPPQRCLREARTPTPAP